MPEWTCKIRIMNFDRINRAKASAFALLRRDKSAAAAMAKPDGGVRLCRTLNRSIWGSTESHPTLSKLRGRGGHGVEISRNTGHASVRLWHGQSLLQHKLENNGISPKTWCWPIFRSAKFEPPASQNDPAEIGRNRSRKFLQFLENFSGGYPPGGEGAE